jgi:rod shape-determining protein MreD
MGIEILLNILRFFVLLGLQILVLNQVEISQAAGFLNPCLYVLFILALPIETPRAWVLILSFITGLTMDIFSDTLGMHTTACLWMGFLRPAIIRLISPREGFEFYFKPTLGYLGLPKYLLYSSILVFVHHFVLFTIEYLSFAEVLPMLLKIFASSIFTLILIFISQQFFSKGKSAQ